MSDAETSEQTRALCRSISGCTVAKNIRTKSMATWGQMEHGCAPLVSSQMFELHLARARKAEIPESAWHLPEPWNGKLETAPLLFVGQNPSLSSTEPYPGSGFGPKWNGRAVADFFENRFGNEDWQIEEGCRVPVWEDGILRKRSSRFLSHIKRLAEVLYAPSKGAIAPGKDYAITEAARCKAADALGVRRAADVCSQRYLDKVLKLCGAKVIVCLGAVAREQVALTLNLSSAKSAAAEEDTDGRLVVFLPHSGARGKQHALSRAVVAKARQHLR